MHSRSNWNFEVLVLERIRKLDNYLGKTSCSKGENQQQTQPPYSRAPAILVGDECSSHCATLTTQTKQGVFTYPSIASCMFCAITWSSTWIHISPAPVTADRPSSIKKKQSVCPHRLMLTSWSSTAASLVSLMISFKESLVSCRSYWPARFLLVPSPLGLTDTCHVETVKREKTRLVS